MARAGVKVRDISNNEGQLAASYDNYNPVMQGDLLLNPMDLYSGANCNMSEISGVISPAYINLRAIKNLHPKYFDYYFKVQYWTMAMFAHGKGVSFDNRWTINAETIKNYELPIPSFDEQDKIVCFLKEKLCQADSLITNEETQIEKLKAYKQSLIAEVVTKGLSTNTPMKESGFSWVSQIPAGWSMKKIKQVASLKTGSTPPSGQSEYYGGDVIWYTPGDFQEDSINKSSRSITDVAVKELNISLFPVGSVLLIGIGGTAGKVAYIEKEGYSNQQITAIIPNKIQSRYLFYYMLSIQKYMKDNAQYTTLPIINNQYLGSIPVVVPSEKEQVAISNYLDEKCSMVDELISIKRKKIDRILQYKKSVIYEYVSGKKQITTV